MKWSTDFDKMELSEEIHKIQDATDIHYSEVEGKMYFGCFLTSWEKGNTSDYPVRDNVYYGKVWKVGKDSYRTIHYCNIILLAYMEEFEEYEHGFNSVEDINDYIKNLPSKHNTISNLCNSW